MYRVYQKAGPLKLQFAATMHCINLTQSPEYFELMLNTQKHKIMYKRRLFSGVARGVPKRGRGCHSKPLHDYFVADKNGG